jgi:hypothetical protein
MISDNLEKPIYALKDISIEKDNGLARNTRSEVILKKYLK